MRRKALVLIALAVVVVVASFPGIAIAAHQPFDTAQATQHPVNQSGVQGRIDFTNATGAVAVSGTATGLKESFGRYVTLVYDVGSVPGGPTACEPTVLLEGMFVGIWSVDANGSGTLIQLGEVAPIGSFDTVSIRDTEINGGFGPEAVVACGEVAIHPASL